MHCILSHYVKGEKQYVILNSQYSLDNPNELILPGYLITLLSHEAPAEDLCVNGSEAMTAMTTWQM